PANPALGPFAKRAPRSKIRVGYYSMDCRNHPVAQLIAPLLEHHDRRKVEIFAFNYGLTADDRMRKRMREAVDHFIDIDGSTDTVAAMPARRLEIDVAVDLAGHTREARTGIFALRAAPVQVNYAGYPGTMGADYYDYIVADATLIPEESRAFYSEKVIY